MHAVLETYFTQEAFAPLIALAKRLEKGIADVIIKHGVAWHVIRVGARVEFMCTPETTAQWRRGGTDDPPPDRRGACITIFSTAA